MQPSARLLLPVRRRPGLQRLRSRGYSMVALVVAIIVLNIAVAAVMPLWSTAIRRSQEEELIFRGLQYAEAIRVFQVARGLMFSGSKTVCEFGPGDKTVRKDNTMCRLLGAFLLAIGL